MITISFSRLLKALQIRGVSPLHPRIQAKLSKTAIRLVAAQRNLGLIALTNGVLGGPDTCQNGLCQRRQSQTVRSQWK